MADELRRGGLHRLNISLDSLDADKFHRITRTGKLSQVLDGIEAARDAGFRNIKLNTVLMKGRGDKEIPELIECARTRHRDITLIEDVLLGQTSELDRGLALCTSEDGHHII